MGLEYILKTLKIVKKGNLCCRPLALLSVKVCVLSKHQRLIGCPFLFAYILTYTYMSYIENNLLPSELVTYEWKIHTFYIFIMSLWVLLGILLLIPWAQAGGGMWMIGFALILPFGYKILYFLTTEIAVTNKRVIYKTGVIARNVFELQLSKVESARLDQTIFQRIIWAWTLIVSGTWWHNKPIEFLSRPTDMRTIIYEEIED